MVKFRRVLCPIDLSESSAGPLACAVAFTRWYKARLTLLTVVPTFDAVQVQSGQLGGRVSFLPPVPREQVVGALRQALDAAGGATLEATLTAETGDPVEAIVEQAVGIPRISS